MRTRHTVLGTWIGGCALVALAETTAAQSPQWPLPKWNGRIDALGDRDADGDVDGSDLTFDASVEQARDTHDLCVLDASVGFDLVLQDLGVSSHFAPIGVVEGNFVMTDPPLDVAASPGTRRALRGTGGLRLYLTHKGTAETETYTFEGWPADTRTFLPHAGLQQTADTLAAEFAGNHSEFAALANLFPPDVPMSVRKVRAFKGPNDRPVLVVACSSLVATHEFSQVPTSNPQSTDDDYMKEARKDRLLRWDIASKKFVDATADLIGSTSPLWSQNTCGLAVGDLNGDTRVDIVFGHYGDHFWGAKSQLYLQRTDGLFEEIQSAQDPFSGINSPATDVEIADLDGDGLNDIVVANRYRFFGPGMAGFVSLNSRNFVLWRTPIVVQGVPPTPDQPTFTVPQYFSSPSGGDQIDDTVALDVADADGDGKLDVVFANHGNPGTSYIPDNPNENDYCAFGSWTLNSDLVYHQLANRAFECFELKDSGGPQFGLTTDIQFQDLARPNRLPNLGTGMQTWDFGVLVAYENVATGQWRAGNVALGSPGLVNARDGFPEIVRVFKTRGGFGLRVYLNDPDDSFDKYWLNGQLTNRYTENGVVKQIPPLSADYSWNFLLLYGSNSGAGAKGPWVLNGSTVPPAHPGMFHDMAWYQTLVNEALVNYPQVICFGDFVPDRPAAEYPVGQSWPSPNGLTAGVTPDLFLGMGYELGGVNNRLVPFATEQRVLRVEGGEYAGVWDGARGEAAWTSGWTEHSSHGYGGALVDAENDGDLDYVSTKRTGLYLYENNGNPAGAGGPEGKFTRVKDPLRWPFVDLPYGHLQLFREDTVACDFDKDGDQDLMVVGWAGQHDYAKNRARGELNNEDQNGDPWLHSPATPNNDRMFHATAFVENLTAAPDNKPGRFAWRSDRLDYNGRVEQNRGGERAVVADFDGDGKQDMLETEWFVESPDSIMPPQTSDPTYGLWETGNAYAYDTIAPQKAIAFRYWKNVKGDAGVPAGTWFQDLTASRVRCQTTSGAHFGPADSRGAADYQLGTTYPKLHARIYRGITAADFNNDGWIDVLAVYGSPSNQEGWNLFLNDGTGVLWDQTSKLPPYSDVNVAGYDSSTGQLPIGPNPSTSQGVTSFDYDLDGDVDIFLSLFGGHRTALIENAFNPQSPPPGGAMGASFAARPFSGASGWVQLELPDLNGMPKSLDWMLWPTPADVDLDGDSDLAIVGAMTAHRVYQNMSKETGAALPKFFHDRSCDTTLACPSTNWTDRSDVLNGMRITAHHGAAGVDMETGDLNGDGLVDLFVEYGERPANPYFNDGAGVLFTGGMPTVSTVFPDHGCRDRQSFRVYGTNLTSLVRVDLKLRGLNPAQTVSISGAGLTQYAHGRFVDAVIPLGTVPAGPATITVVRQVGAAQVASPEFSATNFTVVP